MLVEEDGVVGGWQHPSLCGRLSITRNRLGMLFSMMKKGGYYVEDCLYDMLDDILSPSPETALLIKR